MAQATTPTSQGGSDSGSERFIDKLKDDGLERVRTTQRTAADQLEGVAEAINRAGSELDESQPTVARYVGQLAEGVGSFATRIKEGSLDDLTADAQRFAKSNPAMFLLGSVGVGMVLARFLKASATRGASEASKDSADVTYAGGDWSDNLQAGNRSFVASPEDSGVFDEPRVAGGTADADAAELRAAGEDDPGGASEQGSAAQKRDTFTSFRSGGLDV